MLSNPSLIASIHDTKFKNYICTIGDGIKTNGIYTVSYDKPLNKILDEIQDKYTGAIILEGNYSVTGNFTLRKNGFYLGSSGNVSIKIDHSGSYGFMQALANVTNSTIDNLYFWSPLTVSGQSILRYEQNGRNHKVINNRFAIYPSDSAATYINQSISSPMKCIDMYQVVNKTIVGNEILPYIGVVGIYLEDGSGANVYDNKIYNGFNSSFETLVSLWPFGTLAFPFYRPCKKAIHLVNEKFGWIHHNQITALGFQRTDLGDTTPITIDSGIEYENNNNFENGHMDICDNKLELLATHKQMYLRGIKFSKINDNLIGIPQTAGGINVSYLNGHGALVIEQGTNSTALISISSGSFTDVSRTLTSTGSFTSYTWQQGDVFVATSGTMGSGGTLVTTAIPIKSKTDANNIVLTMDLGSNNDGVTNLVGYVARCATADHLTIMGNQIHNPGSNNSQASGMYMHCVDDVCILNNHVSLVFTKYGIKCGPLVTNTTIRNLTVHFDPLITSKFAIRIDSEGTDEIVLGEITVHNCDSSDIFQNLSSGTVRSNGIYMKNSAATYGVTNGQEIKSTVVAGAGSGVAITVTGITSSDSVIAIVDLTTPANVATSTITNITTNSITLNVSTSAKNLLILWRSVASEPTTNIRMGI